MGWISLCDFDELSEGQGRHVDIDGFSLAVFLHEGKVYVLDSTCPHAGHDLSGGTVQDGCAVCPFHGWNFRLTNGQMPTAPGVAVMTYKTRLLPRLGQSTLVQADLPVF
jgi:nitrite reductase/ring-hydroxylating ferredoxin subunit